MNVPGNDLHHRVEQVQASERMRWTRAAVYGAFVGFSLALIVWQVDPGPLWWLGNPVNLLIWFACSLPIGAIGGVLLESVLPWANGFSFSLEPLVQGLWPEWRGPLLYYPKQASRVVWITLSEDSAAENRRIAELESRLEQLGYAIDDRDEPGSTYRRNHEYVRIQISEAATPHTLLVMSSDGRHATVDSQVELWRQLPSLINDVART